MDFLGSVKYKSFKIVLNYIPSLPILYDDKHQTMFFGSAYPQIMLLDQEPVVARLCFQSYGNVSKSLAAAQLASFRGRPDKTTGGENTHTHTHTHTCTHRFKPHWTCVSCICPDWHMQAYNTANPDPTDPSPTCAGGNLITQACKPPEQQDKNHNWS